LNFDFFTFDFYFLTFPIPQIDQLAIGLRHVSKATKQMEGGWLATLSDFLCICHYRNFNRLRFPSNNWLDGY
jgi:hypothetical protein